MAPTLRKQAKGATKKNTKTRNDGVAKRPARGYHRFRNGMLNVAPKGAEKKLVKTNQQSPLLRLPTEIRDRIWELAFGGRTIDARFIPECLRGEAFPEYFPSEHYSVNEHRGRFALLQVCRQIYAETVLLPISLNFVNLGDVETMSKTLKGLRTFQVAAITRIELDLEINYDTRIPNRRIKQLGVVALQGLPNLQRIHIVKYADLDSFSIADVWEGIWRRWILRALGSRKICITFENCRIHWPFGFTFGACTIDEKRGYVYAKKMRHHLLL